MSHERLGKMVKKNNTEYRKTIIHRKPKIRNTRRGVGSTESKLGIADELEDVANCGQQKKKKMFQVRTRDSAKRVGRGCRQISGESRDSQGGVKR